MRKEIFTVYAAGDDITFIMEETYDEQGEVASTEVKGFYYGEPCDEDTKQFYGDTIATY